MEERPEGWQLVSNLDQMPEPGDLKMIDTELLGMAFEPEQKFEQPDGEPILFDTDYYGRKRSSRIYPGPFAVPLTNKFI